MVPFDALASIVQDLMFCTLNFAGTNSVVHALNNCIISRFAIAGIVVDLVANGAVNPGTELGVGCRG